MSSRQPPPNAPPSYATRMYRHNLRPVVIAVAIVAAIWALFSSIGFFRSISFDKDANFPKLATFSIALGALYAAMFAFEAFGILAAATQRLPLVRIYAFLSAASALIVIAAGLTRVIVHFTFKNDIINECTNLSENQTVAVYPFGFFGPVHHDFIDHDDALRWCTSSWNHDSWADIVSLLVTIILAAFATVVAFSYYRQVLDPSSPANVSRVRTPGFGAPSHYNPPYNASVPNLGYGYPGYQPYSAYAPPPGPPPHGGTEYDGKPPDYQGSNVSLSAEKDNPFADFESSGSSRQERDITSRPGPGGRETF